MKNRFKQTTKTFRIKNKICLIFLGLSFFHFPNIYAQKVLEYDFATGNFNGLVDGTIKSQPYGGLSLIKIINVNTFLYDVEIKGKNINYVTQVPSELQAIFRLPLQENAKKNTEEGKNQAQQLLAVSKGFDQTMKEKKSNLQDSLEKLQKNLAELQSNLKAEEQNLKNAQITVVNKEKKVGSSQSNIEKQAKLKIEKLKKQIRDLNDPTGSSIEMLQMQITDMNDPNDLFNKIVTASKEFAGAASEASDLKIRRIQLIDVVKQDWENIDAMQHACPEPKLYANEMKFIVKKFSETYSTLQQLLAQVTENINSISQIKNLSESSYSKINEDGFIKLIDDINVLQTAIDNKKCFSVISAPIQIGGDFVSFSIEAIPVKTSDLQNHRSSKLFNLEIPVKGGWKTDFSVGPVISFGGNATNDKYYFEVLQTSADSGTLHKRTNNNIISPSLAAMMHFYKRSGTDFSWGGMFGVGAGFQTVSDPKLSLFSGISAVLGKEQKIMISLGISVLPVDRLKEKEYVLNTKTYNMNSIDIANVTEKVFLASPFISISYNLTNRLEVK